MVICEIVSMSITKEQVFKKLDKFLAKRNQFPFRICRLIKDGEFDKALSSPQLTDLLNEGPGKKVKVNSLTASMESLLQDDVVKVLIRGKGRNKKKYWFPSWIDKRKAEDELFLPSSGNNVLFLTGENAWTDSNENFPGLIKLLDGDLCIVDPFYGNGTFFLLRKFGKDRKIRFLSATLGSEEQKDMSNFKVNLKRFKKEFKNIQMKKYDKFYELHDRYIIAQNALISIGYGIKDFANKESFVIFLPKKMVLNFLPNLKRIFEERWKKSNDIT